MIINGNKKVWFYDNEILNVTYNDYIKIIDLKTNLQYINQGVKVNFYGFVGKGDTNDMNIDIKLGDNLLKKYSVSGKGERYEIRISMENYELGRIYVDVSPKNVTKMDIGN